MKKVKWLSCFCAAAILLTSAACTKGGDSSKTGSVSGDGDPFGKYETPITVTSMMLEDNIRNVPEGMTMTDNPWITKFKEYGINVKYKISGSAADLTTKINMAMATNDLPDVMMANAQQFQELTESEYLADLSGVYNTYASDLLKERLNQDNGLMMANGVVNGKRYGIVQPVAYDDYVAVLTVRTDWLKEAGLEEPKTMDDVWNIAKTFKDKKMGGTCTIGIGMTKNVMDALTPTLELLNAYHAYSNVWIEKNGQLANSSIQPEMKTALEKLNGYYKQGLIDPEFGSKDTTKLMEDAISGKSGVIISHFCAPFDTMNGVKNGQEWSYYRMPNSDDQVIKAQQSAAFSGAVVYSAKGKNPEALIKMLNIFTKFSTEDPASYSDNAILNFAYPVAITGVTNANNKIHKEYLEFLKNGKDPASVTQGYDSTKDGAEKWRNSKNIEGYSMYAIFGPKGTQEAVTYAMENDGYLVSAYTGAPTEGMNKYNANLKTLEEQMITNIIKGEKPISYFDEFVTQWKKNGGDQITQEVNKWYSQNK